VGIRFSKSLPEAFIASASPSYCLWGKCVKQKFSSEGNYFLRGFPDIYFSGGQILFFCHDQPCREVCLASAAFPLQKLLQTPFDISHL
jgi:hypothetical protein